MAEEIRMDSATYKKLVAPRVRDLGNQIVNMNKDEFQAFMANPDKFLDDTGLRMSPREKSDFIAAVKNLHDLTSGVIDRINPVATDNGCC